MGGEREIEVKEVEVLGPAAWVGSCTLYMLSAHGLPLHVCWCYSCRKAAHDFT